MEKQLNSNNNQFSLHNVDLFKKTLNYELNEILKKYYDLINDFIKFIFENMMNKNKSYTRYIIIRGLDTITNVFNQILYYTKNLDITYFHSQKAYYFYVEFVQQITNEQNTFLQLSSRDAVMYVYKKTLFEINNEYRKKMIAPNPEENKKWELFNRYIRVYKIIFFRFINDDLFLINDEKNDKLKYLNNICDKINHSSISNENLVFLELFMNKLNGKNISCDIFFECIFLFTKKTNKKIFCKNKIFCDEFDSYLDESPTKLLNWLSG